jgi:hypothetical protein
MASGAFGDVRKYTALSLQQQANFTAVVRSHHVVKKRHLLLLTTQFTGSKKKVKFDAAVNQASSFARRISIVVLIDESSLTN